MEETKFLKELNFTVDKEKALKEEIKAVMQMDKKKVKQETLLYKFMVNFLKSRKLNDTAYIEWNKDSNETKEIEEISPIYSDNVMLYGLIPGQASASNTQTEDRFISYYRNIIGAHFNRLDIKIINRELKLKGVRNLERTVSSTVVDKVYEFFNMEDIPKDKRTLKAQYFKLELHDKNLSTVLKSFNKDKIEAMEKLFLYIGDIDFTQDLGCSFTKDHLINYMLKNNFVMQNNNSKDLFIGDNEGVIIDNNNIVGKTCLSYIKEVDYNKTRFKIYNKFVHSIEVRSNNTKIGTNIYNWINNPEDQLKQTINNSQNTGLTRLEITFYGGVVPNLETIQEQINNLKQLLINSNTASITPIKEQWTRFTEVLKENVFLYDTTNKQVFIAHSFNSLTERINGIYLNKDLPKTQIEILPRLHYLLTYGTFNRTTNLILMEQNDGNIYYTIEQIYINKTDTIYPIQNNKLYPSNKDNIEPSKVGLLDVNNIKYEIPKTNSSNIYIRQKLNPLDVITFVEINKESKCLKFPSRKEIKEQTEDIEFINENREILKDAAVSNLYALETYKETKQKHILQDETLKGLFQLFKTLQKIKCNDLELNTEYSIYAIQTDMYNNIYGLDRINDICIQANTQLKNYMLTMLKSLPQIGKNIYVLDDQKEFLTIRPTERYYKGSYLITSLNIKPITYDRYHALETKIELENYQDTKTEYLSPYTKERNTAKIEELEIGKKYFITALTKKTGTTKNLFFFKTQETENVIYRSNFWLNKLLLEKPELQEIKFYVTIGKEKTTDKFKKERQIFF
jgi:hypothetical protein